MNGSTDVALGSAAALLTVLEAEGVTHVAGLPDNAAAPLIHLLARHPRILYVPVTREGEAFAIAAGLWIGGGTPIVLIQNTGLLESGDAVRGTVVRIGVPLVIIVSCRGFTKLRASGVDPHARPLDRETLVRLDLDSAALLTEPTLAAWGIPWHVLEGDDAARVAFDHARREERPVALLLTRALA